MNPSEEQTFAAEDLENQIKYNPDQYEKNRNIISLFIAQREQGLQDKIKRLEKERDGEDGWTKPLVDEVHRLEDERRLYWDKLKNTRLVLDEAVRSLEDGREVIEQLRIWIVNQYPDGSSRDEKCERLRALYSSVDRWFYGALAHIKKIRGRSYEI